MTGLPLPWRFRRWLARGLDRRFGRLERRLESLERRIDAMQQSLGRIETRQVSARDTPAFRDVEFRVYSQWGEDGIIQHLVRQVPVARDVFVEIGVESFRQANCRFLMVDRNWGGLVVDGDAGAIEKVRRDREYWLHDLRAVHAFVTRENVNRLLCDYGMTGRIGLLSIDVDGMDWWIWESIEVAEPAIVIVEYNYRFGPEASVTVPYDPAFERRRAHPSLLYYGASLEALERLGRRKGYDLVGVGSAGLNAFFVREELRPATIPATSTEEAYLPGRFCEAHDGEGNRIKLSTEEEIALVGGMPVVPIDPSGRAQVT